MTQTTSKPGIYLIVFFDWPQPFEEEHGKKAYQLHQAVQGKDWIKETVAASGGVGGDLTSIWIFWLENYAALDRLLADQDDEVGQAYRGFFSQMAMVRDIVRQEVIFG